MKKLTNQFGELIRKHRLKRNFTQREIGLALAVTNQYISNAERGMSGIAPWHFKIMSHILNVKLGLLVETHLTDYEIRFRGEVR